jgi:hypothetical protein
MSQTESPIDTVVRFLQEIGLEVVRCSEARGFLKHIKIDRGVLYIDAHATAPNLLHEAGHLAVIPATHRPSVGANLEAALAKMLASLDWSDPESPECRVAMYCGESEATAWAWAAGVHLGLAPKDIIADEDYDNTGDQMRLALAHDAYLGINGLCHAGFCGQGALGRRRGQPIYPKLAFWLQGGPAVSLGVSDPGSADRAVKRTI